MSTEKLQAARPRCTVQHPHALASAAKVPQPPHPAPPGGGEMSSKKAAMMVRRGSVASGQTKGSAEGHLASLDAIQAAALMAKMAADEEARGYALPCVAWQCSWSL